LADKVNIASYFDGNTKYYPTDDFYKKISQYYHEQKYCDLVIDKKEKDECYKEF